MEPHDLLRVAAIEPSQSPPGWVGRSLARAPWVVVRRAPVRDGLIPVGVRGARRDQRFACHVRAAAVLERLSPSQLLARSGDLPGDAPICRALTAVEHILHEHLGNVTWGPGGSVGFQLATGVPTIHPDSDLDLVVHCPQPPSRTDARALQRRVRHTAVPDRLPDDHVTRRTAAGRVGRDGHRGGPEDAGGPVLTRDPWTER